MARKKHHKIEWKRLIAKAVEEAIKKVIELLILAILLGAALKLIVIAVPAVAFGAVIAKLAKIYLLN